MTKLLVTVELDSDELAETYAHETDAQLKQLLEQLDKSTWAMFQRAAIQAELERRDNQRYVTIDTPNGTKVRWTHGTTVDPRIFWLIGQSGHNPEVFVVEDLRGNTEKHTAEFLRIEEDQP